MKLDDYCIFTTKGLNFSKYGILNCTMNFYDPAVYSDDEAWYYLTMSYIKDNYIEKVSLLTGFRSYLKYVLRDGDIVLCKLGPYFRSAIFDNAFPFADPEKVKTKATVIVTENVYIIEVDKHRIDPYYIAYIMSLESSKEYFRSVAKGKRTKVLNIDDALALEIPEYTKEMEEKTKEFKLKLLEMGKNYKEEQDRLLNDYGYQMQMENSIREATGKLNDALKSGDLNKMRAAVGRVSLSMRMPRKKK